LPVLFIISENTCYCWSLFEVVYSATYTEAFSSQTYRLTNNISYMTLNDPYTVLQTSSWRSTRA